MAIVSKNTVPNLAENEFELPVGYVDKSGVFHKTFKLREMTGEVEEAMADKKIRTNPGKMVTEAIYGVLESLGTLPKIDRMIVKQLSNVDRDFILLMNYKYSLGDEIEWVTACPFCDTRIDVKAEVDKFPVKYMTEDEPRLLTVELSTGITNDETQEKHKEITLSFPNGLVQEKVFGTVEKNPAEALSIMLAMCTENIKGLNNWNYETFKKMSKKDRKILNNAINDVEVGAELFAKISCPDCGADHDSVVPFMQLLGE